MKQKLAQSEVQQRAKLRASEERRMVHAVETMEELMKKHGFDGHELSDLYTLKTRLAWAIKHQHISDKRYAEYKNSQAPIGF